MHGSFTTARPVEEEPLPLSVRQVIHDAIRSGQTVLFVEQHGQRFEVHTRDGSRFVRTIVHTQQAAAA